MRTARDHMPVLCAHCDRAAADGAVSPAGRQLGPATDQSVAKFPGCLDPWVTVP
jgi:hypothetical protein